MAAGVSFHKSCISEELRDEGRAQGLEQGRAQRGAEDVLLVLEQRGLEVPDHVRVRITECGDPDVLRHWLARAVTAPSAEAVFEDECPDVDDPRPWQARPRPGVGPRGVCHAAHLSPYELRDVLNGALRAVRT